jgi:hypothetical protein
MDHEVVGNGRVGSRQIGSWLLQCIKHRPPETGMKGSDYAAGAGRPAA